MTAAFTIRGWVHGLLRKRSALAAAAIDTDRTRAARVVLHDLERHCRSQVQAALALWVQAGRPDVRRLDRLATKLGTSHAHLITVALDALELVPGQTLAELGRLRRRVARLEGRPDGWRSHTVAGVVEATCPGPVCLSWVMQQDMRMDLLRFGGRGQVRIQEVKFNDFIVWQAAHGFVLEGEMLDVFEPASIGTIVSVIGTAQAAGDRLSVVLEGWASPHGPQERPQDVDYYNADVVPGSRDGLPVDPDRGFEVLLCDAHATWRDEWRHGGPRDGRCVRCERGEPFPPPDPEDD